MTAARPLLLALALTALLGAVGAGAPAGGPLVAGTAVAHPEPGDMDGDEIKDEVDNCPTVKNGAQTDTDGDGDGDACDADDDADGVPDTGDNCRIDANPSQEDGDGDGYGDACPPVDRDGDGVIDDDDNCDLAANAGQSDLDGDDKGDACDRDDDGDRYDDGYDVCPAIYDPDQTDVDGDGIGTACDPEERIATPPPAGGTPPPASPAPPPAPAAAQSARDTTAPAVSLGALRSGRASRTLVLTVRCSEACTVRSQLTRGGATLARGAWELGEAGTTYVFTRWTAAGRKRVRAARASLRATLRLTARDRAGNVTTVSRAIRVRR